MNQNYQAILYDGVVMPLVDSNDSLIDTILSETLNNLFTISKSGQIIDSSGNFLDNLEYYGIRAVVEYF